MVVSLEVHLACPGGGGGEQGHDSLRLMRSLECLHRKGHGGGSKGIPKREEEKVNSKK